MVPSSDREHAAQALESVVFPDPFGPIRPSTSPRRIENDTPASAVSRRVALGEVADEEEGSREPAKGTSAGERWASAQSIQLAALLPGVVRSGRLADLTRMLRNTFVPRANDMAESG